MKILATSDLHGYLPDVEPCDILLIAGDVCPATQHHPAYQREWLRESFKPWLESVPAQHIVGIGGNHDFLFENDPAVPKALPWTYLCDSHCDIEGVRIYGTPWVPDLPQWAFYAGDGGCARFQYTEFPENIDILLAHGPPLKHGDYTGPMFGLPRRVGCPYINQRLKEIKPQAFVCGHIHEAYGHYPHPHVKQGVFNVSRCTDLYEPTNPIVEVKIDV